MKKLRRVKFEIIPSVRNISSLQIFRVYICAKGKSENIFTTRDGKFKFQDAYCCNMKLLQGDKFTETLSTPEEIINDFSPVFTI